MISVIICTHNPNVATLKLVLDALRHQTLDQSEWELVIVDNSSKDPVQGIVDLSWHKRGRVIVESQLGLSYSRITGVNNTNNPLIIFIDDDNVPEKNFLELALSFHLKHPQVGCFGGKSLPVFASPPPAWFFSSGVNLGCQDYGDKPYISNYHATGFKLTGYPDKAPIGTGMVILRTAFLTYLNAAKDNMARMELGRKGAALTSGEDNDIILTIVKAGFELAYIPELIIRHHIPQVRYSEKYLLKMAYESNRSWIKVLYIHGMYAKKNVSALEYTYRNLSNWFRFKAWKKGNYIKWMGSRGALQGNKDIK